MSRYRYRKAHGWSALLSLIISLGIYLGVASGYLDTSQKVAQDNQPGLYRVSRFVDGDTIAIDMNGHTEKVRFIGIDTPETHKPNAPVQCYGPAAAAFTKNFIANKNIRLVSDSLSTDRDRYDRLLRYVYLTDGTNVNLKLVQEGYAFYYPYFPFTKSAEFEKAQAAAKAANKGVWGNCTPTETDKGGWISNDQT